jgi:hypothetical protein
MTGKKHSDYSKEDLPIINILCNECGECFEY